MSENNKKENKLIGLYLFLIVCVLVLFILWIVNLYFDAIGGNPFEFSDLKYDESKRSALGALGDYFGGLLNPVLAFLSFIALLWTLKLNQEELAETRKELARAAKAQEDSKKVMDEQLKTQIFQQSDNFFAIMFENILLVQPQTLEASKRIGSSLIDKRDLNSLRVEIRNEKILMRYFRLLFQTFSMLKQILKDQNNEKLNSYIKVVRSQQEDVILELLFIYISENREHPSELHELLKDSNFFKHLKLDVKNLRFKESLEAYEKFKFTGKNEFF